MGQAIPKFNCSSAHLALAQYDSQNGSRSSTDWLYGLDSICSVDWFHMLAQTLKTIISEVSPEDMWDPILYSSPQLFEANAVLSTLNE